MTFTVCIMLTASTTKFILPELVEFHRFSLKRLTIKNNTMGNTSAFLYFKVNSLCNKTLYISQSRYEPYSFAEISLPGNFTSTEQSYEFDDFYSEIPQKTNVLNIDVFAQEGAINRTGSSVTLEIGFS